MADPTLSVTFHLIFGGLCESHECSLKTFRECNIVENWPPERVDLLEAIVKAATSPMSQYETVCLHLFWNAI